MLYYVNIVLSFLKCTCSGYGIKLNLNAATPNNHASKS